MKPSTCARLNELNLRFYAQHAEAFDATRQRPWRGVVRALSHVPDGSGPLRVLDVGAGNGRAVVALQARFGDGYEYLGLDASEPLLERARARHAGPRVRFEARDFVGDGFPSFDHAFDLVLALGVLHHVPGEHERTRALRALAKSLTADGTLVVTIWRYDQDPRFAVRRLGAAETAALLGPAHELESGDALVRFGNEPGAVRYCHFPDAAEIARWLSAAGLHPAARFRADGQDERLNDYLVLRRDRGNSLNG